jgi:putative ABC transport system ATP-binding protein
MNDLTMPAILAQVHQLTGRGLWHAGAEGLILLIGWIGFLPAGGAAAIGFMLRSKSAAVASLVLAVLLGMWSTLCILSLESTDPLFRKVATLCACAVVALFAAIASAVRAFRGGKKASPHPDDRPGGQPSWVTGKLAAVPDHAVQLRNLTRVYRMGTVDVRALAGVSLDIRRGEFLAVVGISGCGKSTLLHLIGGLDTPTSGSVCVDGRELSSMKPYERAFYRRTRVGFVFQSFHLVPSMSALANVALALTFQGTYGAERRLRAREALGRVGLERRATHRPAQLSGGEQQRVVLARALVNRPLLLLADEPTGNLDRRTAAEVIDLIREINRSQGTTVVMVTHDDERAGRIADRVVRLDDGQLVGEGVGR